MDLYKLLLGLAMVIGSIIGFLLSDRDLGEKSKFGFISTSYMITGSITLLIAGILYIIDSF